MKLSVLLMLIAIIGLVLASRFLCGKVFFWTGGGLLGFFVVGLSIGVRRVGKISKTVRIGER